MYFSALPFLVWFHSEKIKHWLFHCIGNTVLCKKDCGIKQDKYTKRQYTAMGKKGFLSFSYFWCDKGTPAVPLFKI